MSYDAFGGLFWIMLKWLYSIPFMSFTHELHCFKLVQEENINWKIKLKQKIEKSLDILKINDI